MTFNDHEGSANCYKFTREHDVELSAADFVPFRSEIAAPETCEDVLFSDESNAALQSLMEQDR